jgi:hypothetical protein
MNAVLSNQDGIKAAQTQQDFGVIVQWPYIPAAGFAAILRVASRATPESPLRFEPIR